MTGSTDVGSIHYEADIKTGAFDSAAASISKTLDGIGGQFQKAEAGSKAFAAALGSIAVGAIGAAGFGIKIAGDLEAARQGFVALLGSAEEADKTMARVKKEAAATPFELTGLVAGTQALTAITKDGDKAVDILLDVGKAIATSGKGQAELDRVVLNLQQISSTGAVTAMDIKQFQSAIPMFNDILKAAGLTTEQLQNSENAAELLFGAFEKAGQGGISFTKALSGVSAVATDVLEKRIPPDKIAALSKAWKVAGDDVDEFNKELDKMGEGAFIDSLDDIGISINDIMKGFDKMDKSIGITSQGFIAQAGTWNQLWSNFMDTITIRASDLVKSLGVFDFAKEALSGLIGVLGQVTSEQGIETIKNFFAFMADNLPIITGIILGGLTPAIVGLASSFVALMLPLLPFIAVGAALGFIIQKLGINFNDLWTAVQIVVDIFRGFDPGAMMNEETWARWEGFTLILLKLQEIIQTYLVPVFIEMWTIISTQLAPTLMHLWEVVAPILIPILKVLAQILVVVVIAAIIAFINILKVTIQNVANTVSYIDWSVTQIVKFFTDLPKNIRNALGGLADIITKPFRDAWAWIEPIINKMKEGMDKINPFHRESPSLVDNVKKGLSVISNEFSSLNDLTFPSASQLAAPAYAGMGGGVPTRNQEINIYVDKVNDMQDVDAIARELGFRADLLPDS